MNKLERVSGVEFYNTIRDTGPLKGLYRQEEEKSLDIYTLGRKAMYFFTDRLVRLHNGILPTYLVWCLLGMVAIFFVIFLRP